MGRPLKIDRNTVTTMRGNFAQICMEVDLGKPLKPAISILDRSYCVEYEGLHLVCFQCGQVRHQKDTCPEMKHQTLCNFNEVAMAEPNLTRTGPSEGPTEGALIVMDSSLSTFGRGCTCKGIPGRIGQVL